MVEGARWKKWLYFYIPLTAFVVGTLFPFYWMLITAFRPDAELYRPWRRRQQHALLDHRTRPGST